MKCESNSEIHVLENFSSIASKMLMFGLWKCDGDFWNRCQDRGSTKIRERGIEIEHWPGMVKVVGQPENFRKHSIILNQFQMMHLLIWLELVILKVRNFHKYLKKIIGLLFHKFSIFIVSWVPSSDKSWYGNKESF